MKNRTKAKPEGVVPGGIVNYIDKHSTPPSANLSRLMDLTLKQPNIDADMLSGPQVCLLLKFLIRISKSERVLEVGTFTGATALAMAEELPANGKLITVDIQDRSIAVDVWRNAGVFDKIAYAIGDAQAVLQNIDGPFDLAFIDADKENYPKYWELVVPKVRHGGIIVADDTLREGRILRPRREDDKAMHAFNMTVAEDTRVDALILPMGDGVTVAVKK